MGRLSSMHQKVDIILREAPDTMTSVGRESRMSWAFHGVHRIATASTGNIYTTATWTRQRAQRFVYRGIDAVRRQRPWGDWQ
jgi:hypothetical protein